jgi:hypothetical protein
VLGLEVGDELCLGIGALPRPLQHQPGRPARGQGLVRPLHDERESVARVLLARAQPLRLAQTLDVARHGGVAAGVPAALKVPKEL